MNCNIELWTTSADGDTLRADNCRLGDIIPKSCTLQLILSISSFLALSGAQEMQMFVFLLDDKCSRAHNIHLSLSGRSQDSLRSGSGHTRSVSGQSQTLRSILGSLRSLSSLSVLTSSDRRSLKYFVLLFWLGSIIHDLPDILRHLCPDKLHWLRNLGKYFVTVHNFL